jgi:2,3-bisphosphoglycerate-independent phosphoglycerate mutase
MTENRLCMLIILDGWGVNPGREGNAVVQARTPSLDTLKAEYPSTQLRCSGEAVGLPEGIMGNSEVGHLNIGAGRIVYQDLLRINRAIRDGAFFENKVLTGIMDTVRGENTALHLIGLLSDGGVHSHVTHLLALLDMARKRGLDKVFVHAILDGRDTSPESGVHFLERLQEHLDLNRFGQIASVCGRYYAMDRDRRWDRTEKAFRLYTRAEGVSEADPIAAVKKSYEKKKTDEFVLPIAIHRNDGQPVATIGDGDGVIFFNFRADRARQITRALTEPDFVEFDRAPLPRLCEYVCMTRYDEEFTLPVVFKPVHLKKILGEVISGQGLRQLRIAETEKYAHVTYFFNGGEETPFPLEDRCLIPSPREVATYDLKPEMSAPEVTREAVDRIRTGQYALIVLNFANMDMVGHSGILPAAIKACETVDSSVGAIVKEVRSLGGVVLITADHGNAEQLVDDSGHPHTFHTLNQVPLFLVDDRRKGASLRAGILADIAPTILDLMGIDAPEEMTGRSLLDPD